MNHKYFYPLLILSVFANSAQATILEESCQRLKSFMSGLSYVFPKQLILENINGYEAQMRDTIQKGSEPTAGKALQSQEILMKVQMAQNALNKQSQYIPNDYLICLSERLSRIENHAKNKKPHAAITEIQSLQKFTQEIREELR